MMQSNLLMYLTAISAVSIHNLVNNINEVTRGSDFMQLKTLDTNWTLTDDLTSKYASCNGSRQSPINIYTKKVKENVNLRLSLTAYDKPISGFLVNQFPTIQLMPFSFKIPRPSAIVSNSLARSFNPYSESHFTLNFIQFFWSQDEKKNLSIHKVDNESYPVEIHFIHFNTAYTNLDEAFSKPDGLLIFAVMAIPSTSESYVIDKFLDEITNVTSHGQQVFVEEDSTWRNLLPADTSRFYRYQGSLVMPPCHESVQWLVFEDKLKLGQKQLKRLRRFKFIGKDLRTNQDIDWSIQRRPIQDLNERIVERSFSLVATKDRSRRRNS